MSVKTIANILPLSLSSKIRDYHQLAKTRLTFTVVLSAVLGYLIAGIVIGPFGPYSIHGSIRYSQTVN